MVRLRASLFGIPSSLLLTIPLLTGCGSCGPSEPGVPAIPFAPPPTEVRMAVDTYHGVEVRDPYRWLEDSGDPDVRAWTAAQNAASRGYLDAVPGRDALAARLEEVLAGPAASWFALAARGGRLFALEDRPPLQQALLVRIEDRSDASSAIVLVDPNAIDPSGETTIDAYWPSPDGRTVAVSLSEGGTEAGDLHLYDVESSRRIDEVIPRVHRGTAGGSVAWTADSTGFWYTRYPSPDEAPPEELDFHQQVRFHRIGEDPAKDRYEIGRDFPRIAEIRLESDGRFVLAEVQRGDGGEFMHFLRLAGGGWQQLTRYEDRVIAAVLGRDGALYLVSRARDPMGEVLRLALGTETPALAKAVTIVPGGPEPIDTDFYDDIGIWATDTDVLVRYQLGGPTEVRIFELSGAPAGVLPAPRPADVGSVVRFDRNRVLYRVQGDLHPPAWLEYDIGTGIGSKTALQEESPADVGSYEVVSETAISADGTEVPIRVVRRKGIRLDGTHPVLLYGYGGYGISQTPRFRPRYFPWLERGGVLAIAHTRGGGEFGEPWHEAGRLERKQNVFDDFAAAGIRLVEAGYTTRDRLVALGGSNGGLLIGAVVTQHPDLFRAAVAVAGPHDAIRSERTANGAFNIPEFGTVEDERQFAAIRAYSPYHSVVEGTPYPAVLLIAGENDPRVEPWHSRKLAARLQRATTSGRPVLLRTTSGVGHGIGTALDERVAEFTDLFAFLFQEVGIRYSDR